MYEILGLIMFYSWIHFWIIQHKYCYEDRTTYERIVTWFAIFMIIMFIIGSTV